MTPSGIGVIKDLALTEFGINKIKFDQIFDGPLPCFEVSAHKKVKQETLIKYLTKNNVIQSNQQNNNKKNDQIKPKDEIIEIAIDINKELKEWFKPKEDLELEDQKVLKFQIIEFEYSRIKLKLRSF